MLKKEEIAAIMPLAQMLTERGVCLEVVAGQPIGNLTMASSNLGCADEDTDKVLFAVASPTDTGRVDAEGLKIVLPSEHGFTKKRTVDVLAAGVNQVKNDARNVVIPAINATRDAIDDALDASSKISKILPDVDVYNYDPIWGGALVDGISTQYTQVDIVGIPVNKLPSLSDEQLHALVNSGSQEIRDFIAREDQECPGHLSAIWQIWFQGSPVSDSDDFGYLSRMLITGSDNKRLNAGTLGDAIDTRKGYDSILVAYLLAKGLYDNPVEGATWGMDLGTFNMTMSAFAAYFGKVIGSVYRSRLTAIEQKTLVINMPVVRNWRLGEGTDNVLLNGDVYKWYLDNGGSIEAVIGNVFGQRTVNGRTVLDMKPQFESVYTDVTNTYAGLHATNRTRVIMTTLTQSVIAHIVAIPMDLWNSRINPDYTKAQVISDVQKYLASGLQVGTSDNIDKIITYCYATMVYGALCTDQFISAMNNYPDQSLSPKVIAAHVIMDMVIQSLMYDVYYKTN